MNSNLSQLFEQQVERTPDLAAVMFNGETLSYRALDRQANILARHLRAEGIGPESIVGICLERSFQMVVSVLATLKAGAACLPLDSTNPRERLQFMVRDSHPTILLTQTELGSQFTGSGRRILFLDQEWINSGEGRSESPATNVAPDNLIYVIYTSGSTGSPKGVAMVHRALANLIDWQLKDSRLTPSARTLQYASLGFDVSFQEMFSTWLSGGTLVLIPADLRLDPRELWKFIRENEIARIFLPFIALQQLAEAAVAEGRTAEGLREVITAGEQLQITSNLRQLFERHPQARLHNQYGPSETHVVTALTLAGDSRQWPTLPSIGRPIQRAKVYLLDSQGAAVTTGEPGELYIGGDALARGYFKRPDLTNERFVPDPFTNDRSARLYRTGDLARHLPGGEIEFLGRIDQQVKIRGHRVELGEIEAALNKTPGVRESVVQVRERVPGQPLLVAYLVADVNGTSNAGALKRNLKQLLPGHMVPAAFVFLERFPLTPSGKVDRKSLPAPERWITNAARSNPNERPWLSIHFQLVQIWEEVLGVKPIGIRDNFFELGGHSLLAVKMMERVREITGRTLPVTALFQGATILHLANLILDEAYAPSPVVELQPRGARHPFYFLHGDIIGGGYYVRDFSRLLGENQPFYVLPPVRIADGGSPSVEQMAAQHLKHLQEHHPHGPYLLGGFCIGGAVAYEMARRLTAEGEHVPFLALIDPELPGTLLRTYSRLLQWLTERGTLAPDQATRLFSRGYRLFYRLREEWNAPLLDKCRFIAGKARRCFAGADRSASASAPLPSATLSTSPKGFSHDQDLLASFQWTLSRYAPPPYHGPVTIFLTEEQEASAPFLPHKWQAVAPQLEVHRIAGKHLGCITTNVEVLAAKVKGCIEQIERVLFSVNVALVGWPCFLLNLLSHEPTIH